MEKKRAFISFDYDHDMELKNLLMGQAKNPDSPFEIIDMSIKETIDHNWKDNARRRIKRCNIVIIICGTHTDTARGVSAELTIAREEDIAHFMLEGRRGLRCIKPKGALPADKIYKWTWDNLKLLIGGAR